MPELHTLARETAHAMVLRTRPSNVLHQPNQRVDLRMAYLQNVKLL